MKNQKALFYAFKWVALIVLIFITISENPSKIMMFILIGFVSIILIWEGIRDFKTKGKLTDSNH